MAELSSPLQVAGLIETNCASDPGIYSIYRFESAPYGETEIGFAIFYGPENDMDNEWLMNVKLLWEAGTVTPDGTEFLKEDWKVAKDPNGYVNNKGERIKQIHLIGKKGEEL